MTYDHRNLDREHHEISGLIPWYLNGSISELERQRVDAHLVSCGNCRDDLVQERIIYQAMTADTAVEYMPAASLKRLQERLNGIDAAVSGDMRTDEWPSGKPRRLSVPWQGLMAASVAVMAVALSLLAADGRFKIGARAAPNYYTVTTPTAHPQGEVIRAVFSPTVTLVELQAILDEAQLRIVSGPTEAGVYSLAANSHRPVKSSLAALRAHSTVRFAESTLPSVGPDDTP
jgi:hypothetical protein